MTQLEERLQQAEAALWALNARERGKRRYRTQVAQILARYVVESPLTVTYACAVEEKRVRGYLQQWDARSFLDRRNGGGTVSG